MSMTRSGLSSWIQSSRHSRWRGWALEVGPADDPQCSQWLSRGTDGMRTLRTAFVLAAAMELAAAAVAQADDTLARIKTIVVIYAENRSFDHLYGSFSGANGIENATAEQKTQLDHDGTPLPY